MKFVKPTNDVAFKKIFGDEQKKEILISFINAMLGLSGDSEIDEIDILNPYQIPKLETLKSALLDIKIKDKQGRIFIIEMQVNNMSDLNKRFAYYAAKSYSSQIERGDEYYKLNPVIFIGILDFIAFEGDKYLTHHLIINTDNYKQELKAMEFHFIELPKFTKKEEELEIILEKWIYFIKNVANLDVIPQNADTEELKTAYKIANQFGWTPEELEIYDNWGIKAQDARGTIQYGIEQGIQYGIEQGMQQGIEQGMQQGIEQGMQQGIEQGIQEGIEQGIQEGEHKKAVDNACKMLIDGMNRDLVIKYTGLSADEVDKLIEVTE